MSKVHIQEISSYLTDKGWEVSNVYSNDLYYVANDFSIYLKVKRKFSDHEVILTFPIFGEFGERSNDLNNILYCEENLKESRLYFDKIKSIEWKKNLKEWVSHLSRNYSLVK